MTARVLPAGSVLAALIALGGDAGAAGQLIDCVSPSASCRPSVHGLRRRDRYRV
jgi:hypothetical protein